MDRLLDRLNAHSRGERRRVVSAFHSVGCRDYFGDDLMLGPPAPPPAVRRPSSTVVHRRRAQVAEREFALRRWAGYDDLAFTPAELKAVVESLRRRATRG